MLLKVILLLLIILIILILTVSTLSITNSNTVTPPSIHKDLFVVLFRYIYNKDVDKFGTLSTTTDTMVS